MTPNSKEAALALLFGQKGEVVEDIKFFVGDSRTKTDEDIWGAVHSALIQERSGTATITTTYNDDAKSVDAKAFLNSL